MSPLPVLLLAFLRIMRKFLFWCGSWVAIIMAILAVAYLTEKFFAINTTAVNLVMGFSFAAVAWAITYTAWVYLEAALYKESQQIIKKRQRSTVHTDR